MKDLDANTFACVYDPWADVPLPYIKYASGTTVTTMATGKYASGTTVATI